MKFVNEYRDPDFARRYSKAIAKIVTKPWIIMEICGGQTHAIMKFGIDKLLPKEITLLHGPGCPVCVTPLEMIDRAIEIAALPQVIFCSFGDMLRVPGSDRDLLSVKADGGDIRVIYSPLDAIEIAKNNPGKQVVFFSVGFETTAPANAMTVVRANQQGIENFSMLAANVLVPPAIEAILSSPDRRVQGFLAPGHVCTVSGFGEYESLAKRYGVPIVVTGFEPMDILQGLFMVIRQLEEGRVEVENQYARSVRRDGNQAARKIMADVFRVVNRKWRGIGEIPRSGLSLKDEYKKFDAERRFGVAEKTVKESSECISGLILTGTRKPNQCPAFGIRCNPDHPLGATMVSSEGACAAYYHYRRNIVPETSKYDKGA